MIDTFLQPGLKHSAVFPTLVLKPFGLLATSETSSDIQRHFTTFPQKSCPK